MTRPLRILVSTTSHKREPLVSTLEVFSKLGMRDIDLNLHHVFKAGEPLHGVIDALHAGDQRVGIASGGWCDFFEDGPVVDETLDSVGRQIEIARSLGVGCLRLFYGRLPAAAFTRHRLALVAQNIRRLGAQHPDMTFVFENHDGASLVPTVCGAILEAVDRANVRMMFDPINFERAGVSAMTALGVLAPWVSHVHLKGRDGAECCEFGAGDVDLVPVLEALLDGGYRGGFTVEYEGPFDRTLRLYKGFRAAQATLASLAHAALG